MLFSIKNIIIKHHAWIILVIILLIAAFLRLYKIADYMTFLGDEGRDVLVVREIIQGNLKFLGPRASAGDFYLGPIYYYLMAPFLFLSGFHPVGPAIMVAIFGIATVYLVYRLGSEFWNKRAGLIAAVLYAVSPLVIAYSRSSWNPNVMPFFSILTLYSAYKAITTKKLWLFVLSGFFLGISLQLHYLSTFLGAILFFYISIAGLLVKEAFIDRIKLLLRQFLAVFAGFIFGLSPFLLFEIKNVFPNTKTILNFIFTSGEVSGGGHFITIISDVYFRMYGRLLTFYRPPDGLFSTLELSQQVWFAATLIIAFVSVGFSIYVLYEKIKGKDKNIPKYLLFPLWLVIGVILFGFYKKPIYDYYFGFMFPVPFILLGILLSSIWNKGKLFSLIAFLIMVVLFAINISGQPFQHEPNRQYDQVRGIAEFIIERSNNKPFNFAIITGGNSDHGYRYIFEINNHHPTTILNTEIDPERVSVEDQLFVVCESLPCQPLGHSLWEIAGFGRAEIEEEWDVSVVKVYKLVHYKD